MYQALLLVSTLYFFSACSRLEHCPSSDGHHACTISEPVNDFSLNSLVLNAKFDKVLRLEKGTKLVVKALSSSPDIYEIDNLLSKQECEHIIDIATKQGLKVGATDSHNDDEQLRVLDMDANGLLNITEMQLTLESNFDVYFDVIDVHEMYSKLELDANNDGFISRSEFANFMTTSKESNRLRDYVNAKKMAKPHIKGRNSETTWIFPNAAQDDALIGEVFDRVRELFRVPSALMSKSVMQVVHYGQNGHYHVHLDSSAVNTKVTCCISPHLQTSVTRACRSCRFMTILLYLNNVEEGGETVFPSASKVSANADGEEQRQVFDDGIKHRLDAAFKSCDEASVKVKPTTGKAIVWYNHKTDAKSGWIGELDLRTRHGSCPIHRGEKWIANFWIQVTDDREWDLSEL